MLELLSAVCKSCQVELRNFKGPIRFRLLIPGQSVGPHFAQASALRVGDLVLIRERPCRVLELSQHKTGKHGKGKLSITALDVLTGRKALDMCPSTAMLEVRRVYETLSGSDIDRWLRMASRVLHAFYAQ